MLNTIPTNIKNDIYSYFHMHIVIFQDPSVQRAVEGTGTTKANLDDYNPFDAQKNATTSANNGGTCIKKQNILIRLTVIQKSALYKQKLVNY